MTEALGMLAAGLAVVLSAGLAACLLRPPSLLPFLPTVYVLGFAEVVALLLALSLADALRPTALAVGLGCVLAAAGAAWHWAAGRRLRAASRSSHGAGAGRRSAAFAAQSRAVERRIGSACG